MHLKRQLKSTSYPVGNILHGLISHPQRPPLLLRNTGERKKLKEFAQLIFPWDNFGIYVVLCCSSDSNIKNT